MSTQGDGTRQGHQWKKATSTCRTLKPSSERSSTAIITSEKSSAKPAPNTCCRIVSVFRLRCPAFLLTQVSKDFLLKSFRPDGNLLRTWVVRIRQRKLRKGFRSTWASGKDPMARQ